MKSLNLTYTVTALANAIACAHSTDEVALLAAVLVQLGDTLTTIAAQRSICGDKEKAKE